MKNILAYQSYHLVGIQGVGMTALALILKEAGKIVTGSDVNEEFLTKNILEERGVSVFTDFSAKSIKDQEVVIYSGGHGGKNNIEVVTARRLNKPAISLAAVLGELSKTKQTIAVCGCHGKTTTSSLSSFVGLELGEDPSYYVGAPSFSGKAPGHFGSGEYFIVEADEYVADPESDLTPKFLYLSPQYILCTSLDFDHVDVYKNLAEVESAYLKFFKKISAGGFLLLNGEQEILIRLGKQAGKKVLSYGFSESNDFIIKNVKLDEATSAFSLYSKKDKLGTFKIKLYGRHNILNAAGVLALYYLLGKDLKKVGRAVGEFSGVKRRIEQYFKLNENYIFDDYAHHPAEIAATIQALRARFPKHALVVFFQPHTYSRTAIMKQEFVDSLAKADAVGLLPIFASAREVKKEQQISSYDLLKEGKNKGLITPFYLLNTVVDWYKFIEKIHEDYEKAVYITVGAGDIYKKTVLIKNILQELL